MESISPGAPAADAKLEVGDVILKIDGKPVTGSIDLVVAIRSHVPGEKVTLTVKRGGKTSQVKVGPGREDRLSPAQRGLAVELGLLELSGASVPSDSATTIASSPSVSRKSDGGLTWA